MAAIEEGLAKARAELVRRGLLLVQDRELPCVVALIAGAPVGGSWWAHAKGHDIFAVLTALGDDPDVVTTRLVGKKVTLVARELWPALVAVVTSGDRWQTTGLSAAARRLLEQVRAEGPLSTDQLARDTPGRRALAAAARELEERLLVRAEQVHTEHGAHARTLDTWERWADAHGLARGLPPVLHARAALERAVRELGGDAKLLPWSAEMKEAPEVRVRPEVSAKRSADRPSKARRRKAGS